MKMKKSKILLALLVVFFTVVVIGSIAALSLNASVHVDPLPGADGQYADVCCGPLCGCSGEYCIGSGNYTCCD
ncbi:MAG: hypothetical protein QG657_3021 [Acidobacteriota bacterium]|nr:hypothetical protein [Acidobacteriota bacterium]